MKRNLYIIGLFAILFSFNLKSQIAVNLDATSFSAKMKQVSNGQIVDVRTPGEFAQGHIQDAIIIDISNNDFTQKTAKLDKSKTLFVYCLTGSRSSAAMNYLKSIGFKEIYNLAGGIIRWRAANLPETTANTSTKQVSMGMTMEQYQSLLNSNKLVLIDFYAEWCSPCKKMKPYLDEISKEMKNKVVVIRIDADANKALMKELKVADVPVLFLYKGKKIAWSGKGYHSKDEIAKKLKSF